MVGEDHTGAIVIANEFDYDEHPIWDQLAKEYPPMTDDEWTAAQSAPQYWHPRSAHSMAAAIAAEMADRDGVTMSTFTKGMALELNRSLSEPTTAIAADPWAGAEDGTQLQLAGNPETAFTRVDWANDTMLGLKDE